VVRSRYPFYLYPCFDAQPLSFAIEASAIADRSDHVIAAHQYILDSILPTGEYFNRFRSCGILKEKKGDIRPDIWQ
jgi:hypothetical protein